jgi:hypothetical protein
MKPDHKDAFGIGDKAAFNCPAGHPEARHA